MRKRREWAVARLFEHYEQIGLKEPMVRLGEIILLLPEIEVYHLMAKMKFKKCFLGSDKLAYI